MSLYDDILIEAEAFFDDVRAAIEVEALSAVAALRKFGIEALADFIRLAQEQSGVTGPDKRAAVLQLAGDFYDRVIEPLDVPGPDALVDPLLRAAWLKTCELVIDGLVQLFKSGGVERVLSVFRSSPQ